eukprot:137253_1
MNNNTEPIEYEVFPYSPYWLFAMVVTGFIGVLLISCMAGHSLYHLYRNQIGNKPARLLYITYFISYLITCIGYALFRTDLILPMGTIINCRLGVYLTTNAVFLSKLLLFIIFLYKIDLVFSNSSLQYSRMFLSIIMITYVVSICSLDFAYMFVAWDIIQFRKTTTSLFGNINGVGICTTGVNVTKEWSIVLGLLFVGDAIFSFLMCFLFVYKLYIVNKPIQRESLNDADEDNKLAILMRKQTLLVLLAMITSFLMLGLGATNKHLGIISLFMPIDATVNVFCIWLMFAFANPIWNKLLYCCCFCGYCCNKENLLQSLSQKMESLRSATDVKHIQNNITIKEDSVELGGNTHTKI